MSIITRGDIQFASAQIPAGATQYSSLRSEALLSDYSIAYRNDLKNMVSLIIAPIVPVKKTSAFYPVYGTENLKLPTRGAKRAPSTSPEIVKWSWSDDQYSCSQRMLKTLIDDRDRANADSELNIEEANTRLLTEKLTLLHEYDTATLLFNTANFSGRTEALGGIDMWDNAASDMTVQVRQAKTYITLGALAVPEDISLAVGYDVWVAMQTNAKMLTRFQYTDPKMLTTEMIASALGIKEIHVGNAVIEEDDGTRSRLWGNYALFYYNSPATGLYDPSMAKTFVPSGSDIKLFSYRIEDLTSDAMRAEYDYDIKITNMNGGFLYSNVVTVPAA